MKSNFTVIIIVLCSLLLTSVLFAQANRPMTLEECIGVALKENSAVRNAERQVNVAGTRVMAARSAVLPRVNTSFSSGKFRRGDQNAIDLIPTQYEILNVPVVNGVGTPVNDLFVGLPGEPTGYEVRPYISRGSEINSNSASIDLSWNAFDFGQSWTNIRAANASQEASRKSFESTRQSTILLVQQRYFEHLKAVRLLDVQQEEVKSNEEQLKRTESMFEIGSVAQGDVYRQRTTLGRSQITLIRQQNSVANSRAALNVAMGRDPRAELNIVDIEASNEQDDYDLTQVMKTSAENNPEIKSLQDNMRSAGLSARVAKLNYLPNVTVSASYDRSNSELDLVYGNFDKNYSLRFGATLSFNLFNGFADQAETERTSLNYHIAQENLVERQRGLQLEVEQAYLTLKAAKEITVINESNLRSAEEDLRLAQERYRVGAGTLLDIINAQFNLTNAKATLVNAKYDMMIARAQLKAGMGTLGK